MTRWLERVLLVIGAAAVASTVTWWAGRCSQDKRTYWYVAGRQQRGGIGYTVLYRVERWSGQVWQITPHQEQANWEKIGAPCGE